MQWVLLGKIILRAVTTAVGVVETSDTTKQGAGKAALASSIVSGLLDGCPQFDPLVYGRPDVQAAVAAYRDAYVHAQNVIAKAEAEGKALAVPA